MRTVGGGPPGRGSLTVVSRSLITIVASPAAQAPRNSPFYILPLGKPHWQGPSTLRLRCEFCISPDPPPLWSSADAECSDGVYLLSLSSLVSVVSFPGSSSNMRLLVQNTGQNDLHKHRQAPWDCSISSLGIGMADERQSSGAGHCAMPQWKSRVCLSPIECLPTPGFINNCMLSQDTIAGPMGTYLGTKYSHKYLVGTQCYLGILVRRERHSGSSRL
jgi:hypothetical protein